MAKMDIEGAKKASRKYKRYKRKYKGNAYWCSKCRYYHKKESKAYKEHSKYRTD